MKYIRTKESFVTPWSNEQRYYIYKVDEMDNSISFARPGISITFSKDSKDSKGLNEFLNNVIMQADTIEELCDAFIIIDEDKKRSVYLKELNWTFDMMQDLGMWSDRTCYGAIWVIDSNGAPTLKSVAKMNDKGKLELL